MPGGRDLFYWWSRKAEQTYDELIDSISGLVGYWPMQETSGTNASDLSSNANDGTYANTPTLGASGPHSGVTSVTFAAASSESLDISDHADYSLITTGTLTVVAWVNANAAAHVSSIVGKGGTSGNTYEWYGWRFNSGGDEGFGANIYETDGTTIMQDWKADATAYADSTWFCVGWEFDETNEEFRLYVDGTEVLDSAASWTAASTTDSTGELWIGGRSDGANYFNGSICRVAIWDNEIGATNHAAIAAKGLVA